MSDDPKVPYRAMPLNYQAIWLALMTIVVGYQTIRQHGWSLSPGQISEAVVTIVLGAYFWGWILWKFWLYKRFPNK
jgi:hypothetical protein